MEMTKEEIITMIRNISSVKQRLQWIVNQLQFHQDCYDWLLRQAEEQEKTQ